MNLEGHITQSWFGGNESNTAYGVADRRFNWLEVLAAEDRRRYIIEAIEGVTGFAIPNKTPSTVRRSIGPRVIARFAAAAAITTRTWHIRNAMYDSSGIWSGVNEWARDIKGLGSFEGDRLEHRYYQYWFVLVRARPRTTSRSLTGSGGCPVAGSRRAADRARLLGCTPDR